ncbi:ABC transporter ATP-binding protein [Aerococcus urinaeequi]|uniref:ABC transporter ATP-binding protein n=1 Tax=Aerococcus urinaeequi TaxID=51665 RepID=UPI000845CE5A|nr:ABC transporter ATP-binding protein [Aerococcus urinaeequi]
MSIIEVKNLQKKFGKFEALSDVSFSVEPGEITGFIGPNGAGKSTTIRILLGIIKKSGGSAKIFGKDVWEDRQEIHKRTSYVPGDIALWNNLSGGEIIDIFMKLHGSGNKAKRDELIERFELDPKKKAKNYSKGNRQKVGLISALAVESDLYLFDEPTSGLDPLMESIFQEEVKKIKKEGKAVLLSSHILSEVERLADKIVIIRQGEIVESGSLDEMRHLTRSVITMESDKDLTPLATMEGVNDFSQEKDQAEFSVDHEHLNEVLRTAATIGIRNIQSAPPTLEDLFIRHYER